MPPHAVAAEERKGGEDGCVQQSSSLLRCITSTAGSCKPARCYSQGDFRIIKSIGHGDMGTVFLVALRGDNSPYAMKVMKKEVLAARENFHRAQTEKEILKALDHPFLPRLLAHFETDKHTFLVTDYCCGGDLNVLRQKQPDKRFSESATRFYAAEVLLALEYLHEHGIIYRDLKPENILIKENGHVMLTDFDLSLNLATKKKTSSSPLFTDKKKKPSKPRPLSCGLHFELPRIITQRRKNTSKSCKKAVARIFPRSCGSSSDCRSNSFVGTEEYVAPEVVWGSGHGLPVDWWTFGVFLYELVYAKTPFKGSRRKDTFYNILCKEVELPGPPTPLKDLIAGLLVKDPEQRLGSRQGALEVRNHAFFQEVRWSEVELVARPPVVPPPFSLEEIERGRKFREIGIDDDHHSQELLARKKKLQAVKQLQEGMLAQACPPALQDVEICSSYDKYAASCDLPPPRLLGEGGDEEEEDGVVVLRTSTLLASDGAREEIGAKTLELLDSKAAVGLVFEVTSEGDGGGGEDGGKVVVVVKNFESEEELQKVQQLVETESNSFDVF
ncbi:protein kinase PINOID [Selaginella moellendorffii]|nr:protein kinase PINOID [Selaginella moellendorffii]|eukprot:XP_002982650.2 protein kinase PINOID [Selaginella moellendorffii]